jgi:DNA-binding NtrC family response regulator
MNYANPILICDENEEYRILLRDMLTRNGFFHVIEASNAIEAIQYFKSKDDYFVLLDAKVVREELIQYLRKQKEFLIFADKSDSKTSYLAAKLGVQHIVSYPLHTRKLIEKIFSLL